MNLCAFETFFPEKRPFFLEGADIFSFGQVNPQNDYGSTALLLFAPHRATAAAVSGRSGSNVLRVAGPDHHRQRGQGDGQDRTVDHRRARRGNARRAR